MTMDAPHHIRKAARALASARLLLNDGDTEGACNRAYYSMFDAANAALLITGSLTTDLLPKKHSSLIGAFGRYMVKTGNAPADLGSAINKVEQLRRLADYTGEAIDRSDAAWAVDQAAALLSFVQRKWTF